MSDQSTAPSQTPSQFVRRWTGSKVLQADHRITERVVLEELAPLGPEDRVLEIGCGPGTWTRKIAEHAGSTVAVDMLASRVEEARSYTSGLPVEVVQGDILNIPLEGQFTKIFSSRAIEYIFDSERLANRLGELSAPGGTVVLITKTRFSIWRGRSRVRRRRVRLAGGPTTPTQKPRSPGQLIRDLAPYGFRPLRVRPVVMRPPVFKGGFNEFPIIPDSLATPVLRASQALFNMTSRPPLRLAALPLLLTECYCISFAKCRE